jgi:hypothetical protein
MLMQSVWDSLDTSHKKWRDTIRNDTTNEELVLWCLKSPKEKQYSGLEILKEWICMCL